MRDRGCSTSQSKRPYQLCKYTIAKTSGHMPHSKINSSLLSSIRVINQNDLDGTNAQNIGAGSFGRCYLKFLCHFQVCVKIVNAGEKSSFVSEANITSKFAHPHLPYLFGVCVAPHRALVLSYHCIGDHAVSLYSALFPKSQVIKVITADVDWINIIRGTLCGLEHLHSKQNIIHNDLKEDKIMMHQYTGYVWVN